MGLNMGTILTFVSTQQNQAGKSANSFKFLHTTITTVFCLFGILIIYNMNQFKLSAIRKVKWWGNHLNNLQLLVHVIFENLE